MYSLPERDLTGKRPVLSVKFWCVRSSFVKIEFVGQYHQLWDSILPQTELTLNLLRCSRIDTPIFAWAQLHGTFDFSAHPIAPLGMRIVLHEKPHQRATWAPHGVEGFYLGPALNYYRCYRGWVIKTQRGILITT